ncbi:two component transcriptional regulator, winged helix family [Sulfurivirga caldicuralii]|uniref:Two component transcriptional regulator, winged helix family n=1 Tax=Sulfurivirga caldicuralii TaxID=364032 RepID=A0A1N6FAQ4_9GAMM|nr:response regulator transcription factor [Sulfurivirga caldicuralii]SIN92349.1 two component transcriptional regulator, winged helix family [Sulfurivirga caldicuralii]
MNTEHKIAIVEDDPHQLSLLEETVREAGFTPLPYTGRQEALEGIQKARPSILVSDIILGDEMDGGFDLVRDLQQTGIVLPIIFLSERHDEFDIITGHTLGAVDYLPKPYNMKLLIAKIRNLLRLTQSSQPADSTLENLVVDPENLAVTWKGEPVYLTATEFEMLQQFAQAGARHLVTYEALQSATQGVVERNTINTHICRIRNAFRKVDPEFDMIQNEYGRGYSWRNKDEKRKH